MVMRTDVAVLVVFFAVVTSAVHTFPVYRLFQLDLVSPSTGDTISRHGSQRASAEGVAISWAQASSAAASSNASLPRRVVVVTAEDLATATAVDDLSSLANRRLIPGVLVLLPRTEPLPPTWREAEARLLTSEFKGAVYFAFRDDVPVDAVLGGGLTLSVSAKEPAAVESPVLANIHATLSGTERGGSGLALPTVAVVAHHDAFAIAPALATGAGASGSAVAVLLEMARMFSRLFHSSPSSRPEYNLAFVLAAGGPLGYAGVRHWIDHLPTDAAVEFALCLESLSPVDGDDGSSDELFLHVSKPAKDPAVQRIYDAFAAGAAAAGSKLTVVQRKVNVAKPEPTWPHEVFALRRILSGTLSRRRTAPDVPLLARSGLADRGALQAAPLARAASAAAEALARVVFPALANSSYGRVFGGPLGPDRRSLSSWASLASEHARPVPTASARDSPPVSALRAALASSVPDAAISSWTYSTTRQAIPAKAAAQDGEDDAEPAVQEPQPRILFYAPVSTTMTAHHRQSALWDWVVALGIAALLAGLHTWLNGVAVVRRQVISFFERRHPAAPSKRKPN